MGKKTKHEILNEALKKDRMKKLEEDKKKAMDLQRDIVKRQMQRREMDAMFWGEDGFIFHFEMVGLFVIIHIAIFFLMPYLESYLYDYSVEHIKYIKELKTPLSDNVMQVVSILGIGEMWFFIMNLYWAVIFRNENSSEARYFINFIMISYNISLFFMFIYKTYFHASRPYFDDYSLADTNLKEPCSGEFGNPSGHSIIATQCMFSLYFYFVNHTYAEYYEENPIKKKAIGFVVLIFDLLLMYSRVYSGRHTFDQVFTGFIISFVNSFFADFYYREHLYKVNFDFRIP